MGNRNFFNRFLKSDLFKAESGEFDSMSACFGFVAASIFAIGLTLLYGANGVNDLRVSASSSIIKELPELRSSVDGGDVRISVFRDEEEGQEYIVARSSNGVAIVPREKKHQGANFFGFGRNGTQIPENKQGSDKDDKDEKNQNDGILVPIRPQGEPEDVDEFMRKMREFFSTHRLPR